jgi:hypothetical protein
VVSFCAADEPTLRDDDKLRSKAIIPMVILCVSFREMFLTEKVIRGCFRVQSFVSLMGYTSVY